MPIPVSCGSCQRKMNLKDDLAGKRIKCPGCGAIVAVPGQQAPVAEPIDEPEEKRPHRRPKRRRSGERGPRPLFSALGIDFTPVKLLLVIGTFLMLGVVCTLVVVLTPVGSMFSSSPSVQAVDVYTAVNGFRSTAVGERILQAKSTPYTIPGRMKILVTRLNPDGAYLMVKVKVSHKEVYAYFAGTRGPVSLMTLTANEIQLQAGSQTVPAMYVLNRNSTGANGYHFGYKPPQQEGRKFDVRDYLGPGKDGWTHEGSVKDEDGAIVFEGRSGMQVKTQIGSERLDGSQDRSPLRDLTGVKTGDDFGSGLVGGPESYVLVTWDKDSVGWMINDDIEQPNDISINWEITCFFPRPANAGNDLTLVVLGKPRPLKVR